MNPTLGDGPVTGALAARFGTTPPPPQQSPYPVLSSVADPGGSSADFLCGSL